MNHGAPSTDTDNWRSKSKATDAAGGRGRSATAGTDPAAIPRTAAGGRVGWAELIYLALLQPNENERVHHVQCLQKERVGCTEMGRPPLKKKKNSKKRAGLIELCPRPGPGMQAKRTGYT